MPPRSKVSPDPLKLGPGPRVIPGVIKQPPTVISRREMVAATIATAACGQGVPTADQFIMVNPHGIAPPRLQIDPKTLDPIHLTAQVSVQPGANAGVNSISLQNPLGLPMEILEIKWMVFSGANVTANGGAIECALNLASVPISQGFIPIWNYGPCRNELQETNASNNGNILFPVYTWKLKHPLFVPAGACLQPTFKHRGMVPNEITVRISYSCRTLPANYIPPKKVKVPYVAAFVSKPFSMTAALATTTDSDVSKETDVVNRWDHPVQVHQWIGRCDEFLTVTGQHFEALENGAPKVTVQIKDSRGEAIVGNIVPAPFRTVFARTTRAWEVDYPMSAHLWYRIQFNFSPIVLSGAVLALFQGRLIQPMVSIIGTHEMDRGGLV